MNKTSTSKLSPPAEADNEAIFLSEALRGYNYWKSEAAALEGAGHRSAREKEYAEAYQVILHTFTKIEK